MTQSDGTIQPLALKDVHTDGGTQIREELDEATIREYAESGKSGAVLPAITVYHDGSAYWLADGFHRFFAAKSLKKSKIRAEVRQGTKRDAVLHAVGANSAHGLRRSNETKRRAVRTLLEDPEWGKESRAWIANQAGVSENLVRRIADEATGIKPSRQEKGPKDVSVDESESDREGDGGFSAPSQSRIPDSEGEDSSKKISPDVPGNGEAVEESADEREPFEADESEGELDRVGQVIDNPSVAEVFKSDSDLRNIQNDIQKIRRDVAAVCERPIGAHVRHQQADSTLKNAWSTLKFARPYAVCGYCGGDGVGCRACYEQGWLPKNKYEAQPQENKA